MHTKLRNLGPKVTELMAFSDQNLGLLKFEILGFYCYYWLLPKITTD